MKRVNYKNGIGIRLFLILLIIILSTGLLSGCKKKTTEGQETQNTVVSEATGTDTESESEAEGSETEVAEAHEGNSEENDEVSEDTEAELDEDGYYYSKEDVALYIHIYGHLPDNYMTKKEAKKLGWSGGSLEKFAPGMVIGGDRFGNYEENLPDGNYTECDIDTYGKKKRGAKRIVFSDDGYIYYTDDHYETFELLYEPDDN